jgi:hypothetical protein
MQPLSSCIASPFFLFSSLPLEGSEENRKRGWLRETSCYQLLDYFSGDSVNTGIIMFEVGNNMYTKKYINILKRVNGFFSTRLVSQQSLNYIRRLHTGLNLISRLQSHLQ